MMRLQRESFELFDQIVGVRFISWPVDVPLCAVLAAESVLGCRQPKEIREQFVESCPKYCVRVVDDAQGVVGSFLIFTAAEIFSKRPGTRAIEYLAREIEIFVTPRIADHFKCAGWHEVSERPKDRP